MVSSRSGCAVLPALAIVDAAAPCGSILVRWLSITTVVPNPFMVGREPLDTFPVPRSWEPCPQCSTKFT
jgi:hypothetical protein